MRMLQEFVVYLSRLLKEGGQSCGDDSDNSARNRRSTVMGPRVQHYGRLIIALVSKLLPCPCCSHRLHQRSFSHTESDEVSN